MTMESSISLTLNFATLYLDNTHCLTQQECRSHFVAFEQMKNALHGGEKEFFI
jgi:hypothetical protein